LAYRLTTGRETSPLIDIPPLLWRRGELHVSFLQNFLGTPVLSIVTRPSPLRSGQSVALDDTDRVAWTSQN